MSYNRKLIEDFINNQPVKAVTKIDFSKGEIAYSPSIKQNQVIDKISGEEEIARAVFMTKLVNEYGYPLNALEIEKEYTMGRPKVTYPRIDVIVHDAKGNAFLFIELKSPDKFTENQDKVIEEQLFNLSGAEIAKGSKIDYLVLSTCDLSTDLRTTAIVIDYSGFSSFDDWNSDRQSGDEIPVNYGREIKSPYIKGGSKDLDKNYSKELIDNLRRNLHNQLWGGGGTDDNEVFASLVRIILAKIQDEYEKDDGQIYDFQSFSYTSGAGGAFETNQQLFERINELYRRALRRRMYITDQDVLDKSYVIDEKKFSLSKLKYTVMSLQQYSLVEGKNSYNGKDILGSFFEGIIRDGFKQSKGQFFTHVNIVTFMLWALQLDKLAISKVNKDIELPYLIDPSAGSATFLIEYMKFITKNIKYRFKSQLKSTRDVEEKYNSWFIPDNRENQWARDFIYGIETNFNLGTASKVNMILHGDGSTNIFVKDGLLPFTSYDKDFGINELNKSKDDTLYSDTGNIGKPVNGRFDIVMSNPPFSVAMEDEVKRYLPKGYLFGGKKNSENLFIERYYQLLKPNGRLGAILPESVFDTTENKYIRLFIFKYFKVKALVSLPQITFQPYTNTKTSILFAQKKTASEIKTWNSAWSTASNDWNKIKTRIENTIDVYINNKDRNKLPSIKSLTPDEEKALIQQALKDLIAPGDANMDVKDLITKYKVDLDAFCSYDKDTSGVFGRINTTWVFGEVSSKLSYDTFMAEADNVGYKRTSRRELPLPNELYRVNDKGEVMVDDGVKTTILDYMRTIQWD